MHARRPSNMAEDVPSKPTENKAEDRDEGKLSHAVENSFRSCPESPITPILVTELGARNVDFNSGDVPQQKDQLAVDNKKPDITQLTECLCAPLILLLSLVS